jgi:hypothetical protein
VIHVKDSRQLFNSALLKSPYAALKVWLRAEDSELFDWAVERSAQSRALGNYSPLESHTYGQFPERLSGDGCRCVQLPHIEFEVQADGKRMFNTLYNHLASALFNLGQHAEMMGAGPAQDAVLEACEQISACLDVPEPFTIVVRPSLPFPHTQTAYNQAHTLIHTRT